MINKEKWSEIILDWQEKEIPHTIPREHEINIESDIQRAIAIIGPRRAGKTYQMFILAKKIKEKYGKDKTLYVNFERADLGIITNNDLINMLDVYYEIFPQNKKKRIWLFLDEIQNVYGWEKFVRTCLDNNLKVIISGSSSKLLSIEIATSMRGRSLSYELFPFSFKEFLISKNFHIKKYYSSEEKSHLNKYVTEYIQWGGYPEAIIYSPEREKILRDIFETAILKDVLERHKIRNVTVLRLFIKALLTSHEFSIHKFYNYLKSQGIKIGKNILYQYLNYLEEAFFIFPLRKYSKSYKKSEQSIPKIYFIDSGLLTINGVDDKGKLLENIVYIELKRKNLNISYYQNVYNQEVDFVAFKGKKIKQLIQVCYNIDDFTTFEREVNILVKAAEEFKCKNLCIITKDKNAEEIIKSKKIRIISIDKWLLES